MTRLRAACLLAVTTGGVTLFGGVAWWALTYWQVWTNDYLPLSQASRCLLADSSICRLAAALCTGQHRPLVTLYSPWIVWLGVSTLFCGAGSLAWCRTPSGDDR